MYMAANLKGGSQKEFYEEFQGFFSKKKDKRGPKRASKGMKKPSFAC